MSKDRSELDKWAMHCRSVAECTEVLAWLERNEYITWDTMKSPREILASYYEIDLKELEVQRRALLENIKAPTKGEDDA